jgi:TP901 family phage tail tape measure protein
VASAVVGALRVLLSLDSAEFDTAMKRVSSSAKSWSSDLSNIGRQATAVGSALTTSLTLPMVGLGIAAVKAASDFESSFAGVRKTVDATEPEFAALAQGLRDMAKEIPVNVNELNKVAEAAGQLGIKKDDILQFTRTMADLGVTTNLTADEAATATAQIQNIFGSAGKDVDRFGATLVALGNAGASTEKDIIEMGARIAGAGNQIGLTQAQVLSFANGLASVGINAEAGGSAISRTFLKINDAVAKGGEGMAEFARVSGMSSKDFKQAWEKDAASATVAFIEGLKRLKDSGENVNVTLEGLVGKNIIIKDTLMRASGAGDLLRSSLELGNKAWQDNSALVKEAGERYKTFESQLKVLWNQAQDVAITFGTALLPTLKDLISAVTPLAVAFGKLANAFAALPEPIRLIAVGLAGLVAATGPLIWAFGMVATNVGVVIKAFTAKGIATRALTATYAPLTAALTAVGTSFVAMGALAATGVVALYKVGEAFVDLYKHWQAGGTMWSFFSARDDDNFVRRWLGLSNSIKGVNIALSGAGEAAAEFTGPTDKAAASVTSLGTASDLTKKQIKDLAKAESDRLEQLKAASALETKIRQENEQFRTQAIAGIEKEKAAWREYYNWLGERRMENDAQSMVPIATSMTLPWTKFKDVVLQNSPKMVKSFENISEAIRNIGSTILAAVQGGGDVLASVGSSIGMSIGKDMAENLGGFLRRNLGKTLGDAFGAVMPGIGALLGPALTALGSGLKKVFGIGINEEVKKANGEIDKLRKTLIETHGPLDVIEQKFRAVGLSAQENWAHQGKAGLAAFNELIAEFDRRWAELQAKREELEGNLEDTRGEFDSLIGKANELGFEFDKNGQFIGVSFDAVKKKADEFGVSVDGLGGDVGGILVGMKDEIGKLVADSIKLGTTIPNNMKPWIEELIRTGQLTDENGKAITDLSLIKFGEPVKTEFEKISTALPEVVNKINELITRISEIPTERTFTVRKEYVDPGAPAGFYDGGDSGGGSTDDGFASGTLGRLGKWFGSFPKAGFQTALHGIEAVVTPQQAPQFAMDVLSGMGGSSAAVGGDSSALLSEIQGLRRDLLTTIPAMSESASRHGAQTAGRRR